MMFDLNVDAMKNFWSTAKDEKDGKALLKKQQNLKSIKKKRYKLY